jgi:hypothetical protein
VVPSGRRSDLRWADFLTSSREDETAKFIYLPSSLLRNLTAKGYVNCKPEILAGKCLLILCIYIPFHVHTSSGKLTHGNKYRNIMGRSDNL